MMRGDNNLQHNFKVHNFPPKLRKMRYFATGIKRPRGTCNDIASCLSPAPTEQVASSLSAALV